MQDATGKVCGQRFDIVTQRQAKASKRLEELSSKLASLEDLQRQANLCVYACGSYDRLEASDLSDLDLFFIEDDAALGQTSPVMSRLDTMLISADIIRLVRSMRFPEFSNDGEFLQVHSLKAMLQDLGGRNDDFQNLFTARALLLLESRPVYNSSTYARILDRIVDTYLRDYYHHQGEFRPTFLLNDIQRFWKTLCLNYEHRRNRNGSDEMAKAKHRQRNLKLKFSRALTCFGTIIPLAANPRSTKKDIVALVGMPPLNRLRSAASHVRAQGILTTLEEGYSWFLEQCGMPDQLGRLADDTYWHDASGRGNRFTNQLYEFLRLCVEDQPDALRYLLV
jgi:hypothetical protein